jgi:hypothetical protein
MDVSAERFQRRDVDDADLVRERTPQPVAEELIERCEKGRERLAGSRRSSDERVPAGMNVWPARPLGGGRLREGLGEPARNDRVE